jgi:hypothetical protein
MTASTRFNAHAAATEVTDSVVEDAAVTEDVDVVGVIIVEAEVDHAEVLVAHDLLRTKSQVESSVTLGDFT